MKLQNESFYNFRTLYKHIGVSEQAVSQAKKRSEQREKDIIDLIIKVNKYRDQHPGCGLRKMYWQLQPLTFGRDVFEDICFDLGFALKKKKNRIKTTLPGFYKWENYIQGMIINQINMIWQSDITYILKGDNTYYITFIEDVYSRKIIGYKVSKNLKARATVGCLKQALKNRNLTKNNSLIHHSDRGSQYTSIVYLQLLNQFDIVTSMAHCAQENAYVERVNGIIKNEYLDFRVIKGFISLVKHVKQAVEHYNNIRIHNNLPKRMSPSQFEKKYVNLDSSHRPKLVVHGEGNYKILNNNRSINSISEMDMKKFVCPIY